MQRGFGLRALVAIVFWAVAAPVVAQEGQTVLSPVLVVESDRLYTDSVFGRRIAAEIGEASTELSAENRRIEQELSSEEKDLTDRRPDLTPEEFRALADAFDQKVRTVRQEQETKARALVQRRERARAAFLTAALPILEGLMQESGAAVILEQRSVFLSLNAIDVTDDALARIDAEIEDGRSLTGFATGD